MFQKFTDNRTACVQEEEEEEEKEKEEEKEEEDEEREEGYQIIKKRIRTKI